MRATTHDVRCVSRFLLGIDSHLLHVYPVNVGGNECACSAHP